MPSLAEASVWGFSRGVDTTSNAPLAMRRPLRAAANSEGRCRRAAGPNVARMKQALRLSGRKPASGLDGQALATLGTRGIDHGAASARSEEHTSEVQSRENL